MSAFGAMALRATSSNSDFPIPQNLCSPRAALRHPVQGDLTHPFTRHALSFGGPQLQPSVPIAQS